MEAGSASRSVFPSRTPELTPPLPAATSGQAARQALLDGWRQGVAALQMDGRRRHVRGCQQGAWAGDVGEVQPEELDHEGVVLLADASIEEVVVGGETSIRVIEQGVKGQ